jgi:hypothetical protein
MTNPKTTHTRPRKWVVVLYRAVGEFKQGERRMTVAWGFKLGTYKSEKLARKAWLKIYRGPYRAFIHKEGNKQKKIIEIQVFDDDYSSE